MTEMTELLLRFRRHEPCCLIQKSRQLPARKSHLTKLKEERETEPAFLPYARKILPLHQLPLHTAHLFFCHVIAQHLPAGGERFRERLSAFEESGKRKSEADEQQTAIKGRAVEPHFLSPPPRARPKVQRSGDQDSEEYKAKKHPPVPKEKPQRQPRRSEKRQRDPQRLEKHRKGRQDEEQDHQKKHQREGKHKERIRQRTREAPPEQILLLIVQRDVCKGRRQCPRHFSHFQQRNKKRRTPAARRKAL